LGCIRVEALLLASTISARKEYFLHIKKASMSKNKIDIDACKFIIIN
jgi:hypothetical protein